MAYGLTPQGFVIPTIEEILDEIHSDILETIDPALNLAPDQPLGQICAIFAKKIVEVWEIAGALANAQNPDNAENFMLDNVSAITGTLREAARKSAVSLNCNVNAGFSALAGAMTANVDGQDEVTFVNKEDVGPLASGTHPIEFEATVVGPVAAPAGQLTVITIPVSGWNSCTNPLDATLGSFDETDESLRLRREEERAATGACTVDAIRADLLQVDGVQQAFVFENTTLETDGNGLPGKSIECVIYDGTGVDADDQDVGDVVWKSKPSGSETYGSTTQNVTDSTGVTRTVKFSRADVKEVWLEYDVLVDPNFFPSNGDELIEAAAVLYASRYLNLGVDVFSLAFKAQALTVAGVLDVTELRLGFAASPVGTTNLTITGREIGSIDTSRIDVSITNGSP